MVLMFNYRILVKQMIWQMEYYAVVQEEAEGYLLLWENVIKWRHIENIICISKIYMYFF